MTTNAARFRDALTAQYATLFATDPDYAYSAAHTTPEALADKMTTSLMSDRASKGGKAIKAVCRILGIKHTYSAIKARLFAE